jgi:ubiquitin-protein ligase
MNLPIIHPPQYHIQRKRTYTEIEELENYYKNIEVTFAKKQNIILHLTQPINKNSPKDILLEISLNYPFTGPTLWIPRQSSSPSQIIFYNNSIEYILYKETIHPPKHLLSYVKEYGNYPIDHFFCNNFIENIWSPSYHIHTILIEIERINIIKNLTKYSFLLDKLVPTDIRRHIISFLYAFIPVKI